jgi:hypothetical protein
MNEFLKVKFFKFYDFLEDGKLSKALTFFEDPLHYGSFLESDSENEKILSGNDTKINIPII